MRIISRAVLENVVIFDRRNLSAKGAEKKDGHFDLTDFIIKDREKVLNASLVLYDDGHTLKFIMASIGMKVQGYDEFRKHIHRSNEGLHILFETIKSEAKKSIVVVDDDEEGAIVPEVEDIIISQSKVMEDNSEQGHETNKGNKKVRTRKKHSSIGRTARAVK